MSQVRNYMLTTLVIILTVFVVGSKIRLLDTQEKHYCVYLLEWKDSVSESASQEIERVLQNMESSVEGLESYSIVDIDQANWDQLSVLTFSSEDAMISFQENSHFEEMQMLYEINAAEVASYEYSE